MLVQHGGMARNSKIDPPADLRSLTKDDVTGCNSCRNYVQISRVAAR